MPARLPLRRLLAGACRLALPSLLALLALVLVAHLSLEAAIVAAIAILASLAIMLRPHLRHLAALAGYAGEQAAGRSAAAPVAGAFGLDRQLGLHLSDALKNWRER